MLTKVALNKREIDKLIRIKRYKEAIDQLEHVRDIIRLMARKKVDLLLKEGIIKETEKKSFYKMVFNDINKKLLEDKEYVLMDEEYLETLKENYLKLRLARRGFSKNR